MPIVKISDTARLTAHARAREAERPDALFTDPYAVRLAGIVGGELANESGGASTITGAIACRTKVFDDLVMKKVRQEGVDLVLNLAAGLDTRPWRLNLPPALRWIDADLADILEYKQGLLSDEQPRCVYEAWSTDFEDMDALDRLLDRIREASNVLVLSEGLLVYLKPDHVGELARRLHRHGACKSWITDLAGPRALAMMERAWGSVLQGATFQFAPPDAASFFSAVGWCETEFRSSQEEARRLGRAASAPLVGRIVLALAPAKFKEEIRRLTGVAVLERVGTPVGSEPLSRKAVYA
jgi:methyltransferase (TIGR00027 family)